MFILNYKGLPSVRVWPTCTHNHPDKPWPGTLPGIPTPSTARAQSSWRREVQSPVPRSSGDTVRCRDRCTRRCRATQLTCCWGRRCRCRSLFSRDPIFRPNFLESEAKSFSCVRFYCGRQSLTRPNVASTSRRRLTTSGERSSRRWRNSSSCRQWFPSLCSSGSLNWKGCWTSRCDYFVGAILASRCD